MVTQEDLDKIEMSEYNLTPEAVKSYMFGLEVMDPKTGQPVPNDFYQHTLENAVAQAEQTLDIAIFPRYEVEYHDFHSEEFNSYVYTHVFKRPIIQVERFSLSMNGRDLYNYPRDWWNVYNLSGHIEVLPSPLMQATSTMGAVSPTGQPFPMVYNLRPGTAMGFAPQMIEVQYVAGLLPRTNAMHNRQWEMPATLEKYILKLAVREIFQLWGRLLIQPGLASTSLSVDGISESMGTTQSAMYGAVSADITQINADLAELEKGLRSYFGNNFISV